MLFTSIERRTWHDFVFQDAIETQISLKGKKIGAEDVNLSCSLCFISD